MTDLYNAKTDGDLLRVTKSPMIYRRDSTGALRWWRYDVEGAQYRTLSGLEGSPGTVSAWTTCAGKQKRTDEQQAQFEASAEERKKLDREYRRTVLELEDVPMSPMLAKKFEDERKRVEQVWQNGHYVFSQPKLDGIRALITKSGAFTREYQRHHNVDHILKALEPIFAAKPDLVIDGELYNHELKGDFNTITSIVRKQKATDEQRAEAARLIQYHVYDVIAPDLSLFGERNRFMITMFSALDRGIIELVPTLICSGLNRLDELYGVYLDQGYEGQMVRLDAPYEADKRSKALLKRKEFITAEFPLLRIEEGQGNWAGYAKRIVFKLSDGRECGAGLRGTQERAKELLAIGVLPANATVTIRHFTPTPNGMPRFPVAIDIHLQGRAD